MATSILILCAFLSIFLFVSCFILSIFIGFYQKKIPGLDYNSLVETAFLEGHYYGKYWNHKNNEGNWTWVMPDSYIKKKALEFRDDDTEKIIKYRKKLVKTIKIRTVLFVIIGFIYAIVFFISLFVDSK
ncbi:hypothetical protein E4O05_10215 [Treponema sp. OMZ 787]|uniref:hypothetical protein n=1 Tax=Treponema sp. OMZ 787 TaxID=2563669 RepID=UPI0020A2CC81|nr:hypothetical protein [Treponema sp. OMZ 787]UTC61893.1 hypothetical protein E4O05_10215 [Treponema sp. OMZ 787]